MSTRRHPRLLLGLGSLVLAAVGVGAGVGIGIGSSTGPAPAPLPSHLVVGTVRADPLGPDQVGRLVGTPLASGPWSSRPAPVPEAPWPCAVAAGPATEAVYGRQWTAFRSATYQDAFGHLLVHQAVGVFRDGSQAAAAFGTLATGLGQCSSMTLTDRSGRTTTWTYTAYPPGRAALMWTEAANDGSGWTCYHQARATGRALVEVDVCEAGDGRPAASRLADALAGRVTGSLDPVDPGQAR